MRNEKLSYILRNVKLSDCQHILDNIYYVKKIVKHMVYNPDKQAKEPSYNECEFLIVADAGIKKTIIYNCGNIDLHWYTFKKWRNQGILSRALRTGVIKKVWPNIKTVTCCYDWNDNREDKYRMTEHLASLAGLGMSDEKSFWTNE